MRRSTLMLACCLALLGPSAGAADVATVPETFAERLAESRLSLVVGDRQFGGPGGEVLARAVERARYVLIGEDHLTREIPTFTADLCRLMARDGLTALAVEVGAQAVQVVNANLRRPDRRERIASFMRTHPDAMAFQNGRDESDMAAACAQAAGPAFRLWGLDQAFFGAAGHLLKRMASSGPGPVARAAIARLAADERRATAAALASGSPTDLLIYAMTDGQVAEARVAIAKDGGAGARALFATLEETRAIYLGQNADAYRSNEDRARLMKRTLVDRMDGTRAGSRVLFKFGDAHVRKGVNGLGQRDLGNFVAERADGEGAVSLHLLVVGLRGTRALYDGVGRQVRHERFSLYEDVDAAWLKDLAMAGRAASDGWTLFDLRPFRAKPPRDLPASWKRIVDGFDMVVVASEFTPSTLLGAG